MEFQSRSSSPQNPGVREGPQIPKSPRSSGSGSEFPEQRSGRNPGNSGGGARAEPGGAGTAAGDVPAPGKTGAEFQGCPEEETPPLGILIPGKDGTEFQRCPEEETPPLGILIPGKVGGGGDSRLIPIPEFGSWSPFLAAVPASDPWIPAF